MKHKRQSAYQSVPDHCPVCGTVMHELGCIACEEKAYNEYDETEKIHINIPEFGAMVTGSNDQETVKAIKEICKKVTEVKIYKPKAGDTVNTIYGKGLVVKKEGNEGVLSERYLIKLSKVSEPFKTMHNKQGGLYFMKNELQVI